MKTPAQILKRHRAISAMIEGATTPSERKVAQNAMAKHVERYGQPTSPWPTPQQTAQTLEEQQAYVDQLFREYHARNPVSNPGTSGAKTKKRRTRDGADRIKARADRIKARATERAFRVGAPEYWPSAQKEQARMSAQIDAMLKQAAVNLETRKRESKKLLKEAEMFREKAERLRREQEEAQAQREKVDTGKVLDEALAFLIRDPAFALKDLGKFVTFLVLLMAAIRALYRVTKVVVGTIHRLIPAEARRPLILLVFWMITFLGLTGTSWLLP